MCNIFSIVRVLNDYLCMKNIFVLTQTLKLDMDILILHKLAPDEAGCGGRTESGLVRIRINFMHGSNTQQLVKYITF